MSLNSGIEWTEATWNPVRGCSRISPGCLNCYAERDYARKNKNPKVPGCHGFAVFNERGEPHWTGRVELVPEKLDEPLRRKQPTTYFVNSISDLFHEDLPDEAIDRVFDVMCYADSHTYQILTKRADRMQQYMSRKFPQGALRHIWLGVSVENQQYADERIPLLLQAPAVVRFISAEPLLGPVDLSRYTDCPASDCSRRWCEHGFLDWVIVGGESGPGARPMQAEWAQSLRDQCQAAVVPFFFKQWGEHLPPDQDGALLDGHQVLNCSHAPQRVGKKAAGRLLDGREWNEMPGRENDVKGGLS